ncbi:TPA: hypothetical protein I9Y63_003162 [Legionella pneumophila]|nr:hypothetical protein [Legionella pneumophila]HAT3984180.1 hypothetical protein [Legionella pneumophila]
MRDYWYLASPFSHPSRVSVVGFLDEGLLVFSQSFFSSKPSFSGWIFR